MQWFPMRVTYRRELNVKRVLDSYHVENFLPMRYANVEDADGGHMRLVPAIHNLIFLHATQSDVSRLKSDVPALEPLRYMMAASTLNNTRTIITVPDKQMDDFIRVASAEENEVMFLEQSEFLAREGVRVRIIEGPFAGVEGVIKRIKKSRRVVVAIPDIAAVALTYVNYNHLMVIG